ncbi:kinase-like domain-containing protein [Gaertneriomyces semiglobifer]|nr:kinase-like domain-containing protein [Gaertneriomyces semiglobifer]
MDVPREVYFLRRCKHEGIVGFECWSSDERWGYLVMELCASIPSPAPKTQTHDGQVLSPPTVSRPTIQRSASHDLFDHLSVHRRLPEASSKHIFSQLLDAVTYLHERHIVHLDLKDENIIISPTNTVKLIDFGSAAYSTSPSPTCPDFEPANPVEKLFSQFRGTEASAPPEVVVGRAFKGKPADIWALGVLLYTMLTGKPPFADAYGICHGRLKVEGLGDQVAEVLRGCLEKRPEERWTVAQISQCQWVRGLENATPSDLE